MQENVSFSFLLTDWFVKGGGRLHIQFSSRSEKSDCMQGWYEEIMVNLYIEKCLGMLLHICDTVDVEEHKVFVVTSLLCTSCVKDAVAAMVECSHRDTTEVCVFSRTLGITINRMGRSSKVSPTHNVCFSWEG